MKKDTIKIGLIGVGWWGKNILRNLREIGVLGPVFDLNEKTIQERRRDYPDIEVASSLDEILERNEVTAIAIASSAVTHYEIAKKSLLAGKDVFVEKPLALNVKDGAELIDIADSSGKIIMVGHVLQYHPAVVRLKELIKEGKIGKIHYIYSNRLNIGKLRTEENILWSFAPHDISIMLMLLDEEPKSVRAFGGDYLSRGICDTTLTTLEFSRGVKGHIFVSWLHPFKEQKLVVVGSEAMVVFDDTINEKLVLYRHRIEWKNGKIPVAQKAQGEVIPVENGEPLRLEMEHFIECIVSRKKPKTDGLEGLRVLKVLETAEESLIRK